MKKAKGNLHGVKNSIGNTRLRLFRSLFVAREDAHATYARERIVALREPLSDGVLAAHLAGTCRVGTYLITANGKSPFLVIDVDVHEKSLVRTILKRLRAMKVTGYAERSKSKGFHIWVFFDKPLSSAAARAFAMLVLKGLENPKIEIFPKQDRVVDGGLGNCIWLPLFAPDAKTGRTVFLDKKLKPVRKQWRFLTKIRRVPRRRILSRIRNMEVSSERRSTRPVQSPNAAHVRLAACAQAILFKGVDDGKRNVALFTLAKHLRNAGIEQERVEEFVANANEQCRPPVEDREIRDIVRSVFRRKYTSLGCENAFIASLCGDQCPVKRHRKEGVGSSIDEILSQAEAKPQIHPAQAFHDGKLYYGLKVAPKQHIWVNSNRGAFTRDAIDERFSCDRLPTKSNWEINSIKRFLNERASVKPDVLFSNLRKFMIRKIHFTAPWQATVVVLWVMGTYVHRVFDWYGYLWITSPGRRTGKTLLLEIISALAYNASSIMTDPTEAALFRDTALNASTQVLDEIESLRGADQEKRAGLMSMLNDGFKAGASIPRVNMKAGTIEYHEVFCARALAGINRLAPTLADRCIKIFLKRKRIEERVERSSRRERSRWLQKKRNALHMFGLLFAPAIAKNYRNANSLPIPPEVDDRARDILEPLFSIAKVLDTLDSGLCVTQQLGEAASRIARDRAADEGEDETVVAALEVLSQRFPKHKDQWLLTSQVAWALLQKHDALAWVSNRRQASSILRQLGFRSGSHRSGDNVFRAYSIRKSTLKDLCEGYGLAQRP
jgi:hypothetical protein